MTPQEWLEEAVAVLRYYATMPTITMEGEIGTMRVHDGWSPDHARAFIEAYDKAGVSA